MEENVDFLDSHEVMVGLSVYEVMSLALLFDLKDWNKAAGLL